MIEKIVLAIFDHCDVKNLNVYLISEVFLYEDIHCDFTKNKIVTLYRAEFQKSCYGRDNVTNFFKQDIFQKHAPIIDVDMSWQNDNIKSSTVD